ncbi:F0F1 ATP synthase subunit B [Vreelandella boliviensis]|uniref:ATP synthase subunit b n=1 Tax=Vreelandella boliviensis LC1 TaxID=1072583 RepID=A0A265DZP6_9GAMM|nr:F0F1 ATP synthase subunit B [Halomonas boliviensis]EHJ91556.1 ATP synthase subunit b 2 [Halomonas boliviensis LC1]OZT74779.1 ATP synthase F0 subunit B [Halomonas boliviensis LC1]
MSIDFWSLGLQAVNVIILIWLLSRFFWRPVAAAISKRQDAVGTLLSDAQTAKTNADTLLAEVTTAREGIAAERETMLTEAAKTAEIAANLTLTNAQKQAQTLIDTAQLESVREADALRAELTAQATQLAVNIAQKLLSRLDTAVVQSAFVGLLVEAIGALSADDRQSLRAADQGIEMVSTLDINEQDKATLTQALGQALGSLPALTFVSDSELIAGLEIKTPHFALHNSWQSDLTTIAKALNHAE